jgi:hypothetical protein
MQCAVDIIATALARVRLYYLWLASLRYVGQNRELYQYLMAAVEIIKIA